MLGREERLAHAVAIHIVDWTVRALAIESVSGLRAEGLRRDVLQSRERLVERGSRDLEAFGIRLHDVPVHAVARERRGRRWRSGPVEHHGWKAPLDAANEGDELSTGRGSTTETLGVGEDACSRHTTHDAMSVGLRQLRQLRVGSMRGATHMR